MFNFTTKKDKRTLLDKEIDSVVEFMKEYEPSSEKYVVMSENLERLYKAKSLIKDRFVSPDTIAMGVIAILQILLVLNHEKTDVLTSKAANWIWKGRA